MRYILLSSFLLLAVSVSSQDATVVKPAAYTSSLNNYVRTWDATKPTTDANTITTTSPVQDFKMTTQYFDGLGRPLQTIMKQGSLVTDPANPSSSLNAKDLISPIVYDEFGREVRKYLPYAGTENNGLFKMDPFEQQRVFYTGATSPITGQGETFYYGKTEYEASPLNRAERSYAPGNNWVNSGAINSLPDRGTKAKYWINTTADAVRIWNVADVLNDFGSYSSTAIYTAGELYKNATIDEAGKQMIEFKDKEGKVILKKVQLTDAAYDDGTIGKNHDGWLCTYYIYDDLNNLRAVIQPKAVEQLAISNWQLANDVLNELCFRYEYDNRGRMMMKKVPGAQEVFMIYDARDRLVMTQNGNLRTQGKWMYSQYENGLNRPIATGLIADGSTLVYHKDLAYNSTAYPNLANYSPEELTRTFYDDYTWRSSYGSPLSDTRSSAYDSYLLAASNTTFPYPQAVAQSNAIRGMVTGTRVKVIGSSPAQYLYTVNFYDEKGRLIQVQTQNITGGTDIVTTQYSFSGQPLINILKHEKAGTNAATQIVVTKTTYDDLGRITKTEKNLNSAGYKTIGI